MTEVTKEYAGFFRRGAAVIIDLLLFLVPSIVINMVAFEIVKFFAADGRGWTLLSYFKAEIPYHFIIIIALSSQLIWCAIVAWFLSKYKWHATPGKRLMQVYVTDENDEFVSYKKGFFRTLLPVCLVIAINIMSAGVHTSATDLEKSYEDTIQEFFPVIQQKVSESGKNFKDYMDNSEGRKLYAEELAKLTDERRTEFMQKVQEIGTSGKEKEKSANMLSASFLLIILAWYIVALFTKQKMATHDIIAKTRVVRGRI
jgi:uncharacterized RDD family membrane protein YckC